MKQKYLPLAIAASLTSLRAGDGAPQLNVSYNSQDEIPEAFRPLYTETDGVFNLTGVLGLKTQEDINNIMSGLTKERNDHKATKAVLSRLGDRPIDDILADLDRIPALEAAAKDNNIDEQIAGRLQQETAPLNRQITDLTNKLQNAETQVAEYAKRETNRTIGDSISKAALAAKALPEAVDDITFMAQAIFELNDAGLPVAKADIPGVTPGISPEVWITELKQNKPYYWPASKGAGGRGGDGGAGGNNPFTKENWNMTEQGNLVKQNRTLAEQLAAQAGTTIGGPMPQ